MRRYQGHQWVLPFAVLGLLAGCAPHQVDHLAGPARIQPVAAAGQRTAGWTLDPHQAAQLGDPVPVAGRYTIRPPRGYRLSSVDSPMGSSVLHTWTMEGPARRHGPPPRLVLVEATLPAQESVSVDLDAMLDGYLQDIHRLYTSCQDTPRESGTIDGIRFERTYQSGKGSGSGPYAGAMLHGFVYGSLDGSELVMLMATDREPDSKRTLPLAEASVLTLSGLHR